MKRGVVWGLFLFLLVGGLATDIQAQFSVGAFTGTPLVTNSIYRWHDAPLLGFSAFIPLRSRLFLMAEYQRFGDGNTRFYGTPGLPSANDAIVAWQDERRVQQAIAGIQLQPRMKSSQPRVLLG